MRRMMMALTLIVVFGAALLLMNRASAVAESGYSERDVSGEYVFTLVEIGTEEDPSSGGRIIDYCERAGTLTADGAGTMLYAGTRRCSFKGLEVGTATLIYSVDPTGSVLITVSGDPPGNAAHGQIVDHGRGLLLDGTTMSDPNNLIQQGVAMKR